MSNFGLKNILGVIVGFGFIVMNALTFIHKEKLIDHGLETTAIVTETNPSGWRRNSSVYVKYTIDGVAYNHRLNIQYSGRYRGEEVVILYNPNNPNVITPRDRDNATDNTGALIVYSAVGVLLVLLSISLGRNNAKKAKRKMFI